MPAQQSAARAASPGNALWGDLLADVVEDICLWLPLEDRVALTSCCYALWARPDLLCSAALWGGLELQRRHLAPAQRAQSAGAWLARRRGALRSLHATVDRWRSDLAPLLAGLAGASCFEELRLELWPHSALFQRPGTAAALLGALAALPSLARLELSGLCWASPLCTLSTGSHLQLLHSAAVSYGGWETLAQLRSLTCLRVTACGIQHLSQLSALSTLRELALQSNPLGGNAYSMADFSRLEALTALSLHDCRLRGLPPELGALGALGALDLSLNADLGDYAAVSCLVGCCAGCCIEVFTLSTVRGMECMQTVLQAAPPLTPTLPPCAATHLQHPLFPGAPHPPLALWLPAGPHPHAALPADRPCVAGSGQQQASTRWDRVALACSFRAPPPCCHAAGAE